MGELTGSGGRVCRTALESRIEGPARAPQTRGPYLAVILPCFSLCLLGKGLVRSQHFASLLGFISVIRGGGITGN